jgi:hypothetical protein
MNKNKVITTISIGVCSWLFVCLIIVLITGFYRGSGDCQKGQQQLKNGMCMISSGRYTQPNDDGARMDFNQSYVSEQAQTDYEKTNYFKLNYGFVKYAIPITTIAFILGTFALIKIYSYPIS